MSNEHSLNQKDEDLDLAFPGSELAVAREQLGLTRSDVARELKLSEKYIDSLERGAFDELPSMVFARGYIQSYSKLLRLDVARYLALFDELYGRTSAGSPPQFRSAPGVQSSAKLGDPVIKWSAWIFVLAIIAATVWWWKIQQGADQAVSQLPEAQSVEVESVDGRTLIVPSGIVEESEVSPSAQPDMDVVASESATDDGEASVDESSQSEQTMGAESNVSQAGVVDASESSVTDNPVTTETAQQAVNDGESSLRMTFAGECWISVEDHDGKVLAMRVMPAGSEFTVSGEAPIKLLLGKVEAVGEVLFNGVPVEFNRESRSGVVRLTLPQ